MVEMDLDRQGRRNTALTINIEQDLGSHTQRNMTAAQQSLTDLRVSLNNALNSIMRNEFAILTEPMLRKAESFKSHHGGISMKKSSARNMVKVIPVEAVNGFGLCSEFLA